MDRFKRLQKFSRRFVCTVPSTYCSAWSTTKQTRLKLKPKAERPRTLSVQEVWDRENLYAAEYYERMQFGGAFAAFSEAVFKRLGRPLWKDE